MDVTKLEEKIDKIAVGAAEISMSLGGVQFKTMIELMEFSKLMAVSGLAVPIHLRGNAGACLAICTKALRFGFDPFALAEHSYAMSKKQKDEKGNWSEVETIAYDSFVIHAIIEAHAPLTGRLRMEFNGEGDGRTCTVSAVPKGEKEPLTHTSPTLGELKNMRGRNDKGQIKGSPLWDSAKSDQQLAYDTRRDFCRRYFPEILLGWYDKDEFDEEIRARSATDITPATGIKERLKGKKGAQGFDHGHVERQLENKSASPETPAEPQIASPAAGGEPKPEAVAVRAEMQEPAQVLPEQAEETSLNPKWAEAQDVLAKLEQNIREVGDDELGDYKASGRRIIDGFEGLSDEERDALRGQFTGMVMSEQQRRAQEKKGKRK